MPSEEEYQEGMARYAAMAGTTDVEAYTESVGEDLLKDVIRQDAVMQYLVDQCVQVEQDSTEEDTGSDSSTSDDSSSSGDSSTSDDSSTSGDSSSEDGSAEDTGSENSGE